MPHIFPDDDAYDRMVARIDDGAECPACHSTHYIAREKALGIDLFRCGMCGENWFDMFTRPSEGHLS
jgi:Zn ribbon nucleic-acid-binding protein